jgi:hypothetical protein
MQIALAAPTTKTSYWTKRDVTEQHPARALPWYLYIKTPYSLRRAGKGLGYPMRNLKEHKTKKSREKATPAKWKKIRQRAGELALNQGKAAHQAGDKELQRAKRELLELQTLPLPENG